MALPDKHKSIETHATLLAVLSLVVVAIGGIVEIAPLFYIQNIIEKVEGVRPYTPLELAGRDVYICEGCYVCHSQMIRPMRDEVERYGHYPLAAQSMYDHPFQCGSKRTGPDLARFGGRYSDAWHVDHLIDPQSVVPESVMPKYRYLLRADIDGKRIAQIMSTHAMVGVPYTPAMIEFADSWALLALFVFFIGVWVWAYRPGSRPVHDDMAKSIFRNDLKPAPAAAQDREA